MWRTIFALFVAIFFATPTSTEASEKTTYYEQLIKSHGNILSAKLVVIGPEHFFRSAVSLEHLRQIGCTTFIEEKAHLTELEQSLMLISGETNETKTHPMGIDVRLAIDLNFNDGTKELLVFLSGISRDHVIGYHNNHLITLPKAMHEKLWEWQAKLKPSFPSEYCKTKSSYS